MKEFTKKNLILFLLVVFISALVVSKSADAVVTFFDDFDGTVIDATKWNDDYGTSGVRWCSSTQQSHHSNPGNWQDMAGEPCHGVLQEPPYGLITLNTGLASFSEGVTRAFPYIWAGPPSRPAPFPVSGDFTFEVRMKYDTLRPHGDGLQVFYWENSDPVGNNPPLPAGPSVLAIWGDSSGLRAEIPGSTVSLSYGFDFHMYRLEYANGQYSLYVDDVLRLGPVASTVVPNTIWIGNPVFAFWGPHDWTDITIDYVQVTVPTVEVFLDIKPGSDPNCFNNDGHGVIPVAILGEPDFNVRDIDPGTVALEGMEVKAVGKRDKLLAHYEDVNYDGYEDLVVQILDNDGVFQAGDTTAVLTGNLFDGTPIEGSDFICIVP